MARIRALQASSRAAATHLDATPRPGAGPVCGGWRKKLGGEATQGRCCSAPATSGTSSSSSSEPGEASVNKIAHERGLPNNAQAAPPALICSRTALATTRNDERNPDGPSTKSQNATPRDFICLGSGASTLPFVLRHRFVLLAAAVTSERYDRHDRDAGGRRRHAG